MHRQFVFLRQRHQNAAARGAVEFRHHQARDPCGTMKCLYLRQRILSHRGVEHEQHRVRRRGIDLLDDTHDLFELVHQFGLVLQAPRSVDQQHVDALLLRRRQRIEGEARGIRALRAGNDRHLVALAPDLELLDCRGTKGVAGGQHHLAALGREF